MEADQKNEQALLAQQKVKELIAEGEKQRSLTRLLRQLQEFELGNDAVLQHDEFISKVSLLLEELVRGGEQARIEALLTRLGGLAVGEDAALRGRAVMALSFSFGEVITTGAPELCARVILALANWLRVEEGYQPVCDTVCRQLQQGGRRLMVEGHWQQFESLLDILFRIQSGEIAKNNVVRGLVAKTQDALAADHVLEELLLVSIHGQGPRQLLAEQLITRLGRRAAVFLLEKLLKSQERAERFRLIQLIPATGKVALPVLKEALARELPWYGIRNVVLLIATIGDTSHVPLVLPFLKHEDLRVQQQCIECIERLGGDEKKNHLLLALSQVRDELKVGLVIQLGRLGCADCTETLLDLLADREKISPTERDDLLGEICIALRPVPQQRSAILLRQLLEEIEQSGGGHEALAIIVRRTLQIIEPQLQPAKKEPRTEEEVEVSFDSDPHAAEMARLELRDVESRIQKFLKEDKVKELTAYIVEQAVQAAKNKEFAKAEILRDRLLVVNPNALGEVIRVGEVIEEQQGSSISSHHLSLWSDLYDFLDTEMFTALYRCQSLREYGPEETLVEQGASEPTLYFINEGQAALTCRQGNKDIFIQRMGPGNIVGAAPFFDVTVWTVSLTAITSVKAYVLERTKYMELLRQHPGLDGLLSDFCRRSDNTADLLRRSGENRRGAVRYSVNLLVLSSLLDSHGQPSPQQFKGVLDDISENGLSLVIRIARQESARLLLGRHLVCYLPVNANEVRECKGEIVGVSLQDFVEKDYQVHVRLEKTISAIDFKNILSQWQQ